MRRAPTMDRRRTIRDGSPSRAWVFWFKPAIVRIVSIGRVLDLRGREPATSPVPCGAGGSRTRLVTALGGRAGALVLRLRCAGAAACGDRARARGGERAVPSVHRGQWRGCGSPDMRGSSGRAGRPELLQRPRPAPDVSSQRSVGQFICAVVSGGLPSWEIR